MMLRTRTLGLNDFFAVGDGATPSIDGTEIPTVKGVAAGGLSDENPEVGAAFEPHVVQNDSFTEIS
jgi:hypothetical protein